MKLRAPTFKEALQILDLPHCDFCGGPYVEEKPLKVKNGNKLRICKICDNELKEELV